MKWPDTRWDPPEDEDRRGVRGAVGGVCHPGPVLSSMRDSRGGPNLRIKLLALVVALLLAGPLTLFVLQALGKVLDLAV